MLLPFTIQAKNDADYNTCVKCLERQNPKASANCVICIGCFAAKSYSACVTCMDRHYGDINAMEKCNPHLGDVYGYGLSPYDCQDYYYWIGG